MRPRGLRRPRRSFVTVPRCLALAVYSGEGVFYGLFLGQALLSTQHPGGQEFHVALAPLDGGGQKGFQGQPQRFCVFQHAVEDRAVDLGIPDDPPFAHEFPPRLELGLDERDDPSPLAHELHDNGENQVKPDKRDIHRGQVDGFREGFHMADVRAFHDHDPGVLTQFPRQLAVPHIDGVNPTGAALQKNVGEPSGGRAHVRTHEPVDVQLQVVQHGGQFIAPAAYVGELFLYLDGCIHGDPLSHLVHPLPFHENVAREDQRLSPLATGRQASLDQDFVQPFLFPLLLPRRRCHLPLLPSPRKMKRLSFTLFSQRPEADEFMVRTLYALFKTMRPKQWTKNAFVFTALIFDRKLFMPEPLARTFLAFILFCLASSVVYLINDLADMERDRKHPKKRFRPLASGELSPRVAVLAAVLLTVVVVPAAFWLDTALGWILLGYLVLQVAYSFVLKHVVIIDVMTVAAGFVLRVAAGVVVVDVARFSPWLYVCTTLLALFIAINKRRHELVLLAQNANDHRKILDEYNVAFLDEMNSMVTASTVIAYSLYTFSAPGLPPNHMMMLTIPFVIYGLFRYLYLVHVKGEGGAPDELVLRDIPLFLTLVLWALTVILVLYL